MSPEQVEGKSLDPRSDVYSFGVTCYQMLGGIPPFVGETALSVAVQHLKSRPQPLESLRPTCRRRCAGSCIRCWPRPRRNGLPRPGNLLRELNRVQVEQFGADWPENLPGWESLAAELPPDPRIAATRQLDELMKSAARLRAVRLRRKWFAAGIVVALLSVRAWRGGSRPGRCWPTPGPLRPFLRRNNPACGVNGISRRKSARQPHGKASSTIFPRKSTSHSVPSSKSP